jgi:hypothetical protein
MVEKAKTIDEMVADKKKLREERKKKLKELLNKKKARILKALQIRLRNTEAQQRAGQKAATKLVKESIKPYDTKGYGYFSHETIFDKGKRWS